MLSLVKTEGSGQGRCGSDMMSPLLSRVPQGRVRKLESPLWISDDREGRNQRGLEMGR